MCNASVGSHSMTNRFHTALVVLAMLTPVCAQGSPMAFLQLHSTRYAVASALPADVRRPNPAADIRGSEGLPAGCRALSAARSADGTQWVVTDAGAFVSHGGPFSLLQAPAISAGNHLPIPADTRIAFVAADPPGHIWAATNHGVFVTDGGDWWQRMDRTDGAPYDDLICLHLAPNGDVWAGSAEGAWRLRDGRYRYFWGKRWIPGNRVSSIWTDARARTWLETDGGFACIEERPTRLVDKAAHYDRLTQERHNRRGYIGNIHLKVQGDPTRGWSYEAADSDGLWTGYYVAAMSLRYAATHDQAARRQARRSMSAMLELERLSGIPGYPVRSIATDVEIREGIRGYDPTSTVRVPGETDKYWVRSPVDPHVWCKTDTSSDTMDGHFFAWYLYAEHVADAAEKARVAAVVRRAMDHIIRNDYVLVGHTGRKTRWGVWAPRFLNDDPEWFEQRGINSLSILSHLKVAEHVTGDPKYGRAYEDLIRKHHYLENTLLTRRGALGQWRTINHSDDQLACIAYYPLLRLEKDPARRRLLVQSLARTWEGSPGPEQPIRLQRSSFYNFAYGAITGNPCSPEDGIADLEDWPWELVDWTVRNSQRHDVEVRREPGIDDPIQLNRVVPPSERFLKRWNANPWSADGGSDGMAEHDGSTWLIAYWLGVFHGYIAHDR